MNISKKSVILVSFVLVGGVAAGNVLTAIGTLSGSAQVEGPTFYVAGINGSDVLKVNEAPTKDENFLFRGIGPDYSSEFFVSPELESGEWYEMKVDFYVKAKTSDDTDSGNIQATLLYDTESSQDNLICSKDIEVDSSEYESFSASCNSLDDSGVNTSEITGFTYKLSGGRNSEFNIQADGVTRVEVNAR